MRAQLGAVRATFGAHLRSEMTRRFGVEWVPRKDGDGFELKGITRAQIEKYSTRTQAIDAETAKLVEAWKARHDGQEPDRRQLLYIRQEATMASRQGKEDGEIDWDKLLAEAEAKWEAIDGTRLRDVAGKVSNLRGPGAPREPAQPGAAPSADAQMRVMQTALARVQEHKTTWIRADLMREIADSMPAEAHAMAPADSVALVDRLTDRALAGEAGQVMSLDAPEYPQVPGYLRRELDGRSIYTRPGTTRYATSVQIAREKDLLDATAKEGAPHLTREESARLARREGRGARGSRSGEGHRADPAAFQRPDPGPGCRHPPGDDQRPHRLRHRRPGRYRQDSRGSGSSADVARRR